MTETNSSTLNPVGEALGLFASCIKSGEDWSATCERVQQNASAAMKIAQSELAAGSRNVALLQGDNWRMAEALRKCSEFLTQASKDYAAAGNVELSQLNARHAGIAQKALSAIQPYNRDK